MAKIKDLWQKIKFPKWLTVQLVIVVVVLLLFIAIVIWNEALGSLFIKTPAASLAGTKTPALRPGTPTPLSGEWLETSRQTNGIIFGSIIMVLIIVISVVTLMVRKDRSLLNTDKGSKKRKEKKRRT